MTASTLTVAALPQPGWIYNGIVLHTRLKPFLHRLRYKVWSLLIDIDQLETVFQKISFASYNRFNIISFFDKDHGSGSNLRRYADRLLAAAGTPAPARIFLMCYPRVFGHAFNPLSVYYCFDAAHELTALIYEVRNTFGEKHSYVAPVRDKEKHNGVVRQSRGKLFYVSPFLGQDMTYAFRLNAPDQSLRLHILERDSEGPILTASFSGKQKPLNSNQLALHALKIPLLGLKVILGIHWEALKLWLKGAQYRARPQAPPAASLSDPPIFLDETGHPTFPNET